MTADLLDAVTNQPPDRAWATIIEHVWTTFSATARFSRVRDRDRQSGSWVDRTR